MRNAILLVGACLALSGAPVRADESTREQRATSTLDAVLAGDGETATAHFSDTMKAALPPPRIAGIVGALTQQVGAPSGRGDFRHGCEAGRRATWQRIDFERAALDAKLVFDEEDRVAGLFFVPPQEASPCASGPDTAPLSGRPDAEDDDRERRVTIGGDAWPLPAILTLPEGDGPFPAVVLVHGSGPHDADETIFASKPFRDLARGLADRGVASLRYVKRSKAHGTRMLAETPGFGIDQEVTDDAVGAMAWLAGQARIDSDRVFVVGHSLGAMMGPRICQRSASCAGMVLLAAPSRPLEDLVVEQVRHIGPDQGMDSDMLAAIEQQADNVRRLRRGEPVEGPLLLGLSEAYWSSLSDYSALDVARDADRPALVLQGERDYQVTMLDFSAWRELAARHPGLTLKSYPSLDHLFMSGEGPSTPRDYMEPRHVDDRVTTDIAEWIHHQAAANIGGKQP